MNKESVPVSKAGFVRSAGRSPHDAYGRGDRLKRPGPRSLPKLDVAQKRLQRGPVYPTTAAAPAGNRRALMTQAEVIILYPYKCLKFMSL